MNEENLPAAAPHTEEPPMADPTPTDTANRTASRTNGPGSHANIPGLAPEAKATRAKVVASDVPRRAPRARSTAPDSTARVPTPAASPSNASVASPATAEPSLRPANVEIYQGGADTVSGDAVSITQGGATTVTAGSVQIRQGGIANAQADDISVSMGGIALARADRVSVEMGGMGVAFAREAHLTQGAARSIIAKDVHVDQSLVGTALAGRVSFERPSGVFLLIAGRVEGPVQALLDWRGAIAFGAVFGLVVGLLRRR
jgi:hypothetical protein